MILGSVVLSTTMALATGASAQPARTTLFLDFGGGWLRGGTGVGAATCVLGDFEYPMFLGSAAAADVALAEARRLLAPYGVRVVSQPPPPWLPFSHIRVGGEAGVLNPDPLVNGATCIVDCGNATRRETGFVYADKWISRVTIDEADEGQLALQIGRIAVHEAGHLWGLEHGGASESIMSRFPSAAVPTFTDECVPIDFDEDEGIQCGSTRALFCDETHQNAAVEMLAMFGDGSEDTVPPQIDLRWPTDELVVAPGTIVEVDLTVTDDRGSAGWMLTVPELQWEFVPDDPTDESVSLAIPEGRWTLQVHALDHDRNASLVEVTIEGTTELPPEALPELGPTAQCACRSSGPRPTWMIWLGLVIVALGRRRPAPRVGRASVRP